MPRLSPTRTMSTPASSAMRAEGKSYAVSMTIFSPRDFSACMSATVIRAISSLPATGRWSSIHLKPAHRRGNIAGDAGHLVARVDVNQRRPVRARLSLVELNVAEDDDAVSHGDEVGGGAVDADDARAGLALDGVGLEAGAVLDVQDVHLLEREDIGGAHKLGVDGDAALVVDVRLRNGGAVDLALEHRPHRRPPTKYALSIRDREGTRGDASRFLCAVSVAADPSRLVLRFYRWLPVLGRISRVLSISGLSRCRFDYRKGPKGLLELDAEALGRGGKAEAFVEAMGGRPALFAGEGQLVAAGGAGRRTPGRGGRCRPRPARGRPPRRCRWPRRRPRRYAPWPQRRRAACRR